MAEHVVDLLEDGQMKRVELEGKPVVVARVGAEYFAFGGNCPHYGAPLNEGVLNGHTLMCPWHHACFDLRTAARTEPPAFNDLARYPVSVSDGQVLVTLPNDNERQPARNPDASDPRTFVIVGGGAAGNAAAEQLIRAGFGGKIIVLNAASTVPIDRPNLSKSYLEGKAQADWIPLRSPDWYDARRVDVRTNTRVSRISPETHTITLEGGETLAYDKLILATGATPRELPNTPGSDLGNVLKLRELADADKIIAAAQNAPNKRVVIIGASFIALEAAASLAKGRGLQVTVVGLEAIPFERIFGKEIGQLFQREHEVHGVKFHLSSEIAYLSGKDGVVEAVALKSGERLPADFVLIGVGVRPNTEFLKDAGLQMNERDGSLLVDGNLRTSHADVYAAGDIARYPSNGQTVRIEHWRVAQQHGMVAANNVLGAGEAVAAHVPFFWTEQWDLNVGYVGHAEKWDEIIYRGNLDKKEFLAFYVAGGKLLAAAGMYRDAEMDALEFILQDSAKLNDLTVEKLRDEAFDLVAYARGS